MAEEGKRFTTRTSNILSRAGKSANANQQQAASSSAAAKSGSTTTPTVTQTPKVASTAKAMPSITRPDISTIASKYSVPKTTQSTTQRAQVPDLLANRTWINPLKKASPDLLNWDTWTNSLSSVVNKWLYEVPETITQKFWDSKVADFFSNTMIDTERTLISGVQWYINKLANSDLLPSSNLFPTWLADKVLIHYANKALNNSEAWDILKGQRNSVLKTIFDVTENLDQYDAANKKYKQYKNTAENWAKQWNSILDAIEEWKWDVVSTRVWETVGQMLPSLITAVLTKNPWLTATTIFGNVFWDAYQRSLREINQTPEYANLTTDKKDDLATLMAVSEAWIETLWDLLELAPFTKWKLSINNLLWLKNVLASFVANRQWSAAIEWLEEVATEVLQTVFKKAYWWTDDVTAKELWDIFMDTYLIMQFVWAPWWVAWWAQTYRRNAYVKLLSKEAEKFESFNEFEASAKRWGVNDDSLIQEAWADSKWLTKREAWILKYDVNYVENQEKKTTKLYEEKEKVENKLESLRESWEENKPQINKLETRLQEIDNQINEIDKSIQEYMEIYWDRSETKERQQLTPMQESDINAVVSDVMKSFKLPTEEETNEEEEIPEWEIPTVADSNVTQSKPIDEMSDEEIVKSKNYWENDKPETPQERERQRDVRAEYRIRLLDAANELSEWDVSVILDKSPLSEPMSVFKILAVIGQMENIIKREKNESKKETYKEMKKNAEDKLNALIQWEQQTEKRDNESLLPDTQIDDELFYKNWKKKNQWGIDEFALDVFNQDRSYIPWLKWVKIAWLENLTEADILEIAKSAAHVAWILWIDFNKILEGTRLSVVNLKWEDVEWTKGIGWRQITRWATLPEILQLAIWLKNTSPSVFWHELMHALDKEFLFMHGRILTESWKSIARDSMLKVLWLRNKFNTYKNKWDDYNYWDSSREVLARYAEQYIAYKTDNREYKRLTKEPHYWSDSEFKKLESTFENMIKTQFSEFLLDKTDREIYPDVMGKILELQYDQTQFWLSGEMEMVYKLADMKSQYDKIIEEIWKIKNETIRLEMESTASTLYSNFEMLNRMKEDYLQIQKTTKEIQELIDKITSNALPLTKTADNPNPTPPQNPKIIRLWLPYYWGSNTENGIDKMSKWENPDEDFEKADMEEKNRMKLKNRWKSVKTFRDELKEVWFNLVTPAITRIMNRSPRIAWRLITMETNTAINTYRYKQKAKWFVESLWKLKGKDALEVKRALLDYWALASQQTKDTINEYKQQEIVKLRNVLLKHWFKEQDINDMFYVLNDIWRQYKESWLDITLTDMYFPRVVKDYEWLIDYMNRVSWYNIKVDKETLISKIKKIESDQTKTDKEKENEIRYAVFNEFHYVWTQSNNAKERKLWVLSEWWPWIYAYYENPIEALSKYIETMVTATHRQLFLWWMKEDAGITEWWIINQNTAESVSTILWKLVEEWMISNEDADIIQKSLLAVLNKKPSPKAVTKLKDLTYMTTITNFLSAINQLDDLWMAIIKDKKWLIHVVKAIFGKAWIKYDELWLEDSYEMFREKMWITNWLFKKSFFNAFDRLGKTSFINAAWDSMMHQSQNEKTRKFLYNRLVAMYWKESADRIMKKIDKKDYKWKDWQMDIEILRDLLYQLWSTQPIFTSAMPITYLNHPWSRLCYALSSFTLTRINFLIQGTKTMNNRYWYKTAWAWLMWVSVYLAFFWAVIWDVWDWLKWKKDETALWKFMNEWIEEGLKEVFKEWKSSWLKIWDLSEYDLKTWKKDWTWRFITAKIQPFVFDLGADLKEAIVEHDKDEITDLAKYVPIFGKLVYYWCWDDLESATKKSWDEWNWDEEEERDWDSDEERNWDEEEEWNWDE